MKRSFYEMLGITHDADQSQIDAAYGVATAKLNASNLRGAAEAAVEVQLIRDGYQILSNPEKRARYDAKLRADEAGIKLMFFPNENFARRKLGLETAVFAGLAAVLGTIVYHKLAITMDEVRVEHVQAVARHKDEQPTAIVADTIHSQPVVANAVINDDRKR
jgi:curved DNA-binding protein CbpA